MERPAFVLPLPDDDRDGLGTEGWPIGNLVFLAPDDDLTPGRVLFKCPESGLFLPLVQGEAVRPSPLLAVLGEVLLVFAGPLEWIGLVYVRGRFRADHIHVGPGHSLETINGQLRAQGIALVECSTT